VVLWLSVQAIILGLYKDF
jgi:hypothetical protein